MTQPNKLCPGIPAKDCNYWSACDQICNKCGKVHGKQPPPETVPKDYYERLRLEYQDLVKRSTRDTYHANLWREHVEQQKLKAPDELELMQWLSNQKCNSLTLSRNDENACNYMPASDWIDQNPKDFEDVPKGELQAMRDTNTIWTLQIYQYTPIGSTSWHGATMFSVIRQAAGLGEE